LPTGKSTPSEVILETNVTPELNKQDIYERMRREELLEEEQKVAHSAQLLEDLKHMSITDRILKDEQRTQEAQPSSSSSSAHVEVPKVEQSTILADDMDVDQPDWTADEPAPVAMIVEVTSHDEPLKEYYPSRDVPQPRRTMDPPTMADCPLLTPQSKKAPPPVYSPFLTPKQRAYLRAEGDKRTLARDAMEINEEHSTRHPARSG